MGSAAGAEVRRYLVRQLKALGLRPEVRRATVKRASEAGVVLARVHNIHARIPGSASLSTGHVVLLAHYDSVAGSPGAADDAAGVAAVLEVAGALIAGAGPRNDVDIVLTDGEEAGRPAVAHAAPASCAPNRPPWAAQGRSRRMTRRGIPLATASVVPRTRKPVRSNIDLVPTNAMVRSIRPGGSTGWASTAGAPCEAA